MLPWQGFLHLCHSVPSNSVFQKCWIICGLPQKIINTVFWYVFIAQSDFFDVRSLGLVLGFGQTLISFLFWKNCSNPTILKWSAWWWPRSSSRWRWPLSRSNSISFLICLSGSVLRQRHSGKWSCWLCRRRSWNTWTKSSVLPRKVLLDPLTLYEKNWGKSRLFAGWSADPPVFLLDISHHSLYNREVIEKEGGNNIWKCTQSQSVLSKKIVIFWSETMKMTRSSLIRVSKLRTSSQPSSRFCVASDSDRVDPCAVLRSYRSPRNDPGKNTTFPVFTKIQSNGTLLDPQLNGSARNPNVPDVSDWQKKRCSLRGDVPTKSVNSVLRCNIFLDIHQAVLFLFSARTGSRSLGMSSSKAA